MNRVALERTKAKVYTRTFQSASQPGAGVSRGQNLEKISPKKYFEFNSTSASGKRPKRDGLGGRPGEAATCLQKISLVFLSRTKMDKERFRSKYKIQREAAAMASEDKERWPDSLKDSK